MKKLLKYDFLYLYKTSKISILGAIFVLFSIVTALSTRYTNELLLFFTGGQGFGSDLPEPTVFTAYEQYISDLYEMIFIIILFVIVSIFMRDKTKGLYQMIFSKPINRTKYLLSKYISVICLLALSITLGYLAFSYYTYFLFDKIYFVRGIWMMLMFFLNLVFVAAIALFCSTYSKSYMIGIISTYCIIIVVSLLGILDKVAIIKYFPGVIISNMKSIFYGNMDYLDLTLNIIVTILISGLFVWLSIVKIKKQDI